MMPAKPRTPTEAAEEAAPDLVWVCVEAEPVEVPEDDFELVEPEDAVEPELEPDEPVEEGEAPPVDGALTDWLVAVPSLTVLLRQATELPVWIVVWPE